MTGTGTIELGRLAALPAEERIALNLCDYRPAALAPGAAGAVALRVLQEDLRDKKPGDPT